MAHWIVIITAAYLMIGLVVGIIVVLTGLGRLDPVAAHGTWGFRLLVLPGMAALWPIILSRVVRGVRHPPEESNAHRRAARRKPA
jgi:membrane protein implicated in regulation of membrane protease activity